MFTSGQRVRIRRAAYDSTARCGDVGQIVSTGSTRTGETYHIRIDRTFARSPMQRSRGYDYTMYANQLEAAPAPETTPTFAVGQRVRLRDGRTHLQTHGITDSAGTEGEIEHLANDWQTRNDYGYHIRIRTANDVWNVYRDQIEAIPAPASGVPEPRWVPATEANAVAGARIRYINPGAGDVVRVNDEGVIVNVVDASRFNGINIRMDAPTSQARLSTRDGHSYHWSVALGDIEVLDEPAPAPAEPIWVQATRDNVSVGSRLRHRAGDGGSIRSGDQAVVRRVHEGFVFVFMDDPRGKFVATSHGVDYHWQARIETWDVLVETPSEPATATEPVTYDVVRNGETTTWTVGERVRHASRGEGEVLPRGTVPSANSATIWVECRFGYYQSGFDPAVITRIDPAPATTEPAPAANGAVTFTDEQKRLIAQIATTYGARHGYTDMSSQILAELGIDATATNRRRTRITLEIDVEIEGVDGFQLRANPRDMTSYLRRASANTIVEAVLDRHVRRVGDASVVSRGVTYRD